jgi:hypothetical protein
MLSRVLATKSELASAGEFETVLLEGLKLAFWEQNKI